ncbi:MAG: rhodanese-like domain-containing protein [Saprospiraceae bacterium]|nr:rhodanese-like domain-containing protein [Saprospiraceae bacterium]
MPPIGSIDQPTLTSWTEQAIAFQLVDVREEHERKRFHIGGIHIPLGEILKRVDELDPELPIVLYCRKGIRSQIAIQRLQNQFPDLNLLNLTGGIGT